MYGPAKTGSAPVMYSAKRGFSQASIWSDFERSKWSAPYSADANSGLTRVNASECAGTSNSGTTVTPIDLQKSMNSRNSFFV